MCVGAYSAPGGTTARGREADSHSRRTDALPASSRYSTTMSARPPAASGTTPRCSTPALAVHASTTTVWFTDRRTPSSAVMMKVTSSAKGARTLPLHRTDT